MTAFFIFTIATVGAVALTCASIVLRGWVLTILWGWFAVPLFGVPALSIAQAIGIALVVTLLTHQYVPSKDKDVWMPLAAMIAQPLIALFVGWIVTGFLPASAF